MGLPEDTSDSGLPYMLELKQKLEQMRDALVEISLLLEDFQFVLNGPERLEASQITAEMLNHLKDGQF